MQPRMFARNGSSPMVPVSKAPKQTSLDSFSKPSTSRPSTRLAKKEAKASQNKGPAESVTETTRGILKKVLKIRTTKGKQTRLEDTPTPTPTPSPSPSPSLSPAPPRMAESGNMSVDTTNGSNVEEEWNTYKGRGSGVPSMTPKIRTTEEGRKYLEEMQLIESEDTLDGEVLAGTLTQISLFPSMLQAARDAVRLVALLMVRAGPGEAGTPALSACMERMVSEFTEAIKSVTQSAIAEVKRPRPR